MKSQKKCCLGVLRGKWDIVVKPLKGLSPMQLPSDILTNPNKMTNTFQQNCVYNYCEREFPQGKRVYQYYTEILY